jgi:hypothetical protein
VGVNKKNHTGMIAGNHFANFCIELKNNKLQLIIKQKNICGLQTNLYIFAF